MHASNRVGIGAVFFGAAVAFLTAHRAGASSPEPVRNAAETEFASLQEAYLARYRPLYLKARLTWWDANVTGSDEAFERRTQAENQLVELHSDHEFFAKLKALRQGGQVRDPVLRRQLDVMYRTFVPGQADPELQKKIVALESAVEQVFNTHRSLVDGEPKTENDVRKILAETKDSARAEQAWKAYMEVGAKVESRLRELVRLRNESARQLGYEDFYAMSLFLQEINETELFRLFDELDDLTREPFAELKKRIDTARAARFGISRDRLRPWHYGDLFFQEAPGGGEVNLDEIFQDQDILALAKTYYAGMGMPVEDVLARSDLYEKPGKSPHAFCTDIDRAGDIRILCNLKPNLSWMDTLLHELGHAVYDKYIRKDVPFVLHQASHALTTEGFAMLMGSMAKNEEWLVRVRKLSPDRAAKIVNSARQALRAEKIIFSRWTQVMVRFEHSMYNDPDQDLGKLWWDLKKRYQRLNPPEDVSRPDYGAKIHVVTVPAYYHNYMMGDLFACQLHYHVARNVVGVDDPNKTCFYGRRDVGAYLREKVLGPGNLYSWSELTRRATGEALTGKYFARQYLGSVE